MEKDLQNRVLKHLTLESKSNPIWFYKSSDRYQIGIHDIICCFNGWFVTFELKDPDSYNKETKMQEYNKKEINKCNGYSVALNSWSEYKKQYEFIIKKSRGLNFDKRKK